MLESSDTTFIKRIHRLGSNLYVLLQSEAYPSLDSTTDQATLKKAYHKASLDYHPDKNVGATDVKISQQDINHAREILILNPSKKAMYDALYYRNQAAGAAPGPTVAPPAPPRVFKEKIKIPTVDAMFIYWKGYLASNDAHYKIAFGPGVFYQALDAIGVKVNISVEVPMGDVASHVISADSKQELDKIKTGINEAAEYCYKNLIDSLMKTGITQLGISFNILTGSHTSSAIQIASPNIAPAGDNSVPQLQISGTDANSLKSVVAALNEQSPGLFEMDATGKTARLNHESLGIVVPDSLARLENIPNVITSFLQKNIPASPQIADAPKPSFFPSDKQAPGSDNIILYKSPNNHLVVKFPNQAMRDIFASMIESSAG